MKPLFAFLLVGCGSYHAYMLPVVEVRCPLPTTKTQCQAVISRMCHGSSYLVVLDERSKHEQVFWVSCERSE
jgi:hypothetical protein